MLTTLSSLALGLWGGTKKLGGLLARVPWQAWVALAAILLALFGAHWVEVQIRHADAAGYARAKAEDKAANDKLRAHALDLKSHVEILGAQISKTLKEEHNAKIASVHAAAADILRGGPGKARARLVDPAPTPASAGRHEPAGGSGDAAVAQVPDSGGATLIALPFNDAVRLFGQCDINADEALKWRVSDTQMRALWGEYRKSLATPPK